ncbi:MAG TPA: sugar phosphate isomerase/epimerase family protein [Chthonomonadaceae bacterium]|nr:sugar phosphate isomerase/epimerase family protein [Chthonomonadaceae bacterium]
MSDRGKARLPMALTSHGLPHVMGYLPTQAGEKYAAPLGVRGLIAAAEELRLSGIEVDLPSEETLPTEALRDLLAAHHQRLVVSFNTLRDDNLDQLRQRLRSAAALEARVVRVTLSNILCGDRRSLTEGWEATLRAAARRLKEVLPLAEELGVCLAIENHQDATSEDLLRLWEMVGHSPAFGVTLDTGNPLAVGEDPVEYAGRIAPLLRHLHLKDYTIHFAPNGYRLVRCAAGAGVVDFPAILKIVAGNGWKAMLPGIEVGAQPTRTIPLLELSWWACYPPVPTTRLIPALRILWAKGRPADEPYGSAWERGSDSATVAAEEWEVVRASAAYFHSLGS